MFRKIVNNGGKCTPFAGGKKGANAGFLPAAARIKRQKQIRSSENPFSGFSDDLSVLQNA
ncbi:hypothetical protein NEISICOT_00674 [Neisseria sicca ATCC 29256]|uniref:Uncharacterized protein n=1 Tax=Neisseria sicca ATCC 29256 TaxID=547045 RepID=C6M2D5_NEISI|nr:hypothetical protein NEISICOT_00674 [Neisseria sicca ATCC 29256]